MYRVLYKAVCTNCDHIARKAENKDFLDPFFLPDHCHGCGEYRSSASWPRSNDDWRIEMVMLRLTRLRFHPLKPSTWFSRWEPVAENQLNQRKDHPMNGDYVADGRTVRRRPTKTATGFKMGFPVCSLSEGVADAAAQEIADALNLHLSQHPEKH